MARVNARPRGDACRMELAMTLQSDRREHRKRVLLERIRLEARYRSVYWIREPDHERGIGLLLCEDTLQPGLWMYFPQPDKVIGVVSRGLPALATDFTCEDLLVGVSPTRYDFRALGRDSIDGVAAVKVEMRPRTQDLHQELGFATAIGWVRDDIGMIVRADYLDRNDKVFKRFEATAIERVDSVWTARRFSMTNFRARHRTEVDVVSVDYGVRLAAEDFTPARFGNGFMMPPR